MSRGQPRPHQEMLDLALEVVKLLADFCTRIAVAGSLRRGKAMVGDIEIVCQPDFQYLPSEKGGFVQLKQNALNWICNALWADGTFEPRLNGKLNPQSWGDQQKWARYKGVNLDLYAALPGYSWGRELLIRTGPGDANMVLVTREGQMNRNGHKGILPEPYQFRERELYCGDTLVETPSEADVFAALNMPYIAPPLRTAELYQRWAGRRSSRDGKQAWSKDCEGAAGNAWVGYPPQQGDIWIDGQPHRLRFQKVGVSQEIAV